jgi:hypothetical protein
MALTLAQFNSLPDAPPLPATWDKTVDEYVAALFNHCDRLVQQRDSGRYLYPKRERDAYQFKLLWPYLVLCLHCDLGRRYRVVYAIEGREVNDYRYPELQTNTLPGTYTGTISEADELIYSYYTDTIPVDGTLSFGQVLTLDYVESTIPIRAILEGSGSSYTERWSDSDGAFPAIFQIREPESFTVKVSATTRNTTVESYTLRVTASDVPELDTRTIAYSEQSYSGSYGMEELFKLPGGVSTIIATTDPQKYYPPNLDFYTSSGDLIETVQGINDNVSEDFCKAIAYPIPMGATHVAVVNTSWNYGQTVDVVVDN